MFQVTKIIQLLLKIICLSSREVEIVFRFSLFTVHSAIFLTDSTFFYFRWIQMARKIMSKGSSSNATSSKHHNKQQQRFQPRGSSISESNLSGLCNNNGTHRGRKNRTETGISLNPDTGRHSPDGVTVYKNKVLYHSRADFRSAGLTAQNSAPTFYGDKEGAI